MLASYIIALLAHVQHSASHAVLHHSRMTARHHPVLASASDPLQTNPLQAELVKLRRIRRAGVLAGGGLLTAAVGIGIGAGVLDAPFVLVPAALAAGAAVAYTRSHDETGPPLAVSNFEVKGSLIPDAGMGLFAASPIAAGTFLYEYGGDRLTEDAYYARYPTGQGRYVAEVATLGAPVYIDGESADPAVSGVARWMNSQPTGECNVRKRKQRFGPMGGRMFFYAARDITLGEELLFDYGSDYWDAVDNGDEERHRAREATALAED